MTQAYKQQIDQHVTIVGTARDAHLGAVIIVDGEPVYVDGLEEWDDTTFGKLVQASGTLRRRSIAPNPTVDADGAVSHGIAGDNYVLESAQWHVSS